MITTVFIDIDNTLIDFDRCACGSMGFVLEKHGISPTPHMFKVFLDTNRKLWLEIEKGNLTREGLYKIRWNTVFAQLGITLDGEKFEVEFLKHLPEFVFPIPYAKNLLDYLSKKYSIYATSNAPHNQQLMRLEKAGMLDKFSDIFTSGKIGFPKPDNRFFDGCFNSLENVSKDEVILIGDSLSADIAGAKNYGLKTCWFNFAGEALPVGIKPDFTVNSLEEITKIL